MTSGWRPDRWRSFYRLFAPETVAAWDNYRAMEGPSEYFSIYWLCYAFVGKLEKTIQSVQWTIRHTQDPRYTRQLYQFHDLVTAHVKTCKEMMAKHRPYVETVLTRESIIKESNQRPLYGRVFRKVPCCIGPCYLFTPDGLQICRKLYWDIMAPFDALVSDFLRLWLQDLYYVQKLIGRGLIRIPVPIDCLRLPAARFQDLDSWEVVCSDEEREILCHPLLPDPSDFLVREYVPEGDRFVDKARFQYSFPGSLERHRVVFTETPSVLPILVPAVPERKIESGTATTIASDEGVQVSWCGYAHRKKTHRMKRLSRRMKESRKKKQTRDKQRRRQDVRIETCLEQDGYDDYGYDDWYDDWSDGYSYESRWSYWYE